MKRVLLLSGVLVFGAQGVFALTGVPSPLSAQRAASAANRVTSRITVTVPHDEAELTIEGRTIPGAGTSRDFEAPQLAAGRLYRYAVVVRWRPNTYTTITRTRTVSFRAGARVTVDLTVDDPSDRVRVAYVPTPSDIADEMVRLAGVTASDVVFEPGCGDARITIAAVMGGARRGVGIDIDAARVEDSRARVRDAGLENKIEIRLGDALDIKDLSQATVVFLYMGDHFNMLIRPILWRELEVGARVVSHRFTMGDWKPDKTVIVSSDEGGGEYELHLWIVTEELKRKMAAR
ncbi:MAG: TIGR03000 domain-containing protein [Vicinamibacterales bacterium]